MKLSEALDDLDLLLRHDFHRAGENDQNENDESD
jgi:hypothetical protein